MSLFVEIIKIVLSLIIVIFGAGILYLILRHRHLLKDKDREIDEHCISGSHCDSGLSSADSSEKKLEEDWKQVTKLFASNNEKDWKLAIIDADTMLDELMQEIGYVGKNLGERLKSARKTFSDINLAWKVHLLRNKIAHEGMNFKLKKDEADMAYRTYQIIFRHAGVIS